MNTTFDLDAKTLDYHAACLLFPQLGKVELDELAADIQANGLQKPIVLHEGKILDGRNRYLACQMAGIEPRFVEWKDAGSPIAWVISENLIRRHLSCSQRAIIAHDLLPLLEVEAKQRQQLSLGRGIKVDKELSTFSETGKATEVAAKIAKTNATYVQAVKNIGTTAPELLDHIRSGVLNVPDAAKLAKLPDLERQELLKRVDGEPLNAGDLRNHLHELKKERRHEAAVAFAKQCTDQHNIFHGDMELLWEQLGDNSVDCILTDPPYADVSAYERLAKLAAAKLKPGRLCLAYTGHIYLPEVMEAMGKYLEYWWMFGIRFASSHCAIYPRHIQNVWRPILAYAKPPLEPTTEWLSDLLQGGGRDKEHHVWGQDQSEVEYLIDKLTEPGELIVEPFCGGGSVPAACKALGRRWIATEIDPDTALIARKRLAEMK